MSVWRRSRVTCGQTPMTTTSMSLTLAWVKHPGPAEDVVKGRREHLIPLGRRTFTAALDFHAVEFDIEHEPLLVDRLGAWVVMIAPNGFEYSYPGVAAGASRLGDLVSVFWNVEGHLSVLADARVKSIVGLTSGVAKPIASSYYEKVGVSIAGWQIERQPET